MILPPGTILQLMYLEERLRSVVPGKFIEVGVGRGFVAQTLLDMGWTGIGYDLNPVAVDSASAANKVAVNDGRLQLVTKDWLRSEHDEHVDLVISSMVIEHLDQADEASYFVRCRRCLRSGGRAIVFVPGSPVHHGIEDEIAGHFRRYTFKDLQELFRTHGFQQPHIAGLTYPLSNWLRPVSDVLVRRAERNKQNLSMWEKTVLSGHRAVPFKTSFPDALGWILNKRTMFPFYVLQKWFRDNKSALVIYGEALCP